jgi:hypothetical protein
LNHPEEIFWVVFPANYGSAKVMKPSEQPLHFPAPPVAAQNAAVLRGSCDAHEFVGRDKLHSVALVDALVQRIAVVSAVANHSFGSLGKESLVERGFDEFCFMRRSAGHVLGAGSLIASQLYGVKSYDPLILGAAITLLMISAVLAAILPTRRAASIDPMRALRAD